MARYCTFKAEILGVDSVAEYQDRVYDQTVYLRHMDEEYEVSDSDGVVDSDDVGKALDLVVHLFPEAGATVLEGEQRGIHSLNDGASEWAYEIRGSIETVNGANEWFEQPPGHLLVVDVGTATIIVSCYGELLDMVQSGQLSTGDFVSVCGTRLELIGRLSRTKRRASPAVDDGWWGGNRLPEGGLPCGRQ